MTEHLTEKFQNILIDHNNHGQASRLPIDMWGIIVPYLSRDSANMLSLVSSKFFEIVWKNTKRIVASRFYCMFCIGF